MNAKIRNGLFSERALANLLGVSQPHLHNVLKGERRLHTPLADLLLEKFQISVTDLLDQPDRALSGAQFEAVPDPELARLRELRKRPRSYRRQDRSEWEAV